MNFHRDNARLEDLRSGFAAAPGGKVISKKRPRFGKVAESLQSRWSASLGVVRKRDFTGSSPPKSFR
jgi:hypothetical protein